MTPTQWDVLRDVCDKLTTDAGLECSLEYPGCLVIPDRTRAGLVWCFGTANATWDGDLQSDGSDLVADYGIYRGETLHTDVPSDSTDAGAIALAIARVLLTP